MENEVLIYDQSGRLGANVSTPRYQRANLKAKVHDLFILYAPANYEFPWLISFQSPDSPY